MSMRIACLLSPAMLTTVAALADDSARIGRLETEIQQLRALVDGQARRIQRLEEELNRRAAAPAAPPRPRPGETRTDSTAAAARQPWHSAAAWERVARGMTAEQVAAALGEPTTAESVGALSTLFYRGAAPGGRALSGHVNLKDGRVVAVIKPAF